MYSTWIFLYFDLWGLCTQFEHSKNARRFYGFIFTSHIVLASIFTFSASNFLKRAIGDQLGTLNDMVKLGAVLLVYWLSIFELYFNRTTQRKFWNIIEKFDNEFYCRRNAYYRQYLRKIVIYFLFFILFRLNYLIDLLLFAGRIHFFWICYAVFTAFYTIRLNYYLFFVESIKCELKIIFDCAKFKSSRPLGGNHFKWICKHYGSLYDLSNIINLVFGWSNVATVLLPFCLILTHSNWFYWKIYNKFMINISGKMKVCTAKHKTDISQEECCF